MRALSCVKPEHVTGGEWSHSRSFPSKLLIDEHPLQVLPTLAMRVGLNEAIILQQVHYWLNPKLNKNVFDRHHWVRNTYEQWQQQFPFWGEKTIRWAIGHLEKSNVLLSFVTHDFKKTKYYTINYAKLEELKEAAQVNEEDGSETRTSTVSDQNDQSDLPKRADGTGQYDHFL